MPPAVKNSLKKKTQPTKIEKRVSDAIILKAKAEGLMPHEILLHVARGKPIEVRKLIIYKVKSGAKKGEELRREWVLEDYYPTFVEQMECAKSAAPYFAPRLSSQTVSTDEDTADALTKVMKELSGKLPG